MPKLLVFAPCEKVLIDQRNNVTLISILQEWQPQIRELPEKAVAPQQWEIFTLWHRLEEDGDKEFVQRCELTTDLGEKAISADISFRLTAPTHRNTITVLGLPINPGRYALALFLFEKGAEKDRQLIATFPLLVTQPSH